ncbi:hypothetical protein Pcinc_033763 [Petrolisthes cinctipes]|uniref:Uncharacterized protein n=1 Tax=Petrolisthes cinctipes TaxID=88211 RepID=A0AAE1K0Q2_PETCI|nr:hypothetical protein Pcinc_033763 [Petrolisthes cinctipes]
MEMKLVTFIPKYEKGTGAWRRCVYRWCVTPQGGYWCLEEVCVWLVCYSSGWVLVPGGGVYMAGVLLLRVGTGAWRRCVYGWCVTPQGGYWCLEEVCIWLVCYSSGWVLVPGGGVYMAGVLLLRVTRSLTHSLVVPLSAKVVPELYTGWTCILHE